MTDNEGKLEAAGEPDETHPGGPPARDVERVRAAIRSDDLEAARAALDELARKAPGARETEGLELELLWRSGDIAAAVILAKRLVERYPGSARILWLAGRVAYKEKRYDDAERWLRESDRLFPSEDARRFVGKTLTQRGKFEAAEAILLPLAESRIACELDLAWLAERRGDTARALEHIERFLAVFPDSDYAQSQKRRLRGMDVEPAQLREEVETLLALDEEVPEEWLRPYVESLLASGDAEAARDFIDARVAEWPERLLLRIGWPAYKAAAYDIAWPLFARAFEIGSRDFKYLAALETAAKRAGRLARLAELYEEAGRDTPRFLGRARKVRSWLREA